MTSVRVPRSQRGTSVRVPRSLQWAVDFEVETVVGKPAREIVRYAEEHDVDEIIIGSHGRTGVSRVLLGDVAEKVVRRAPVTVTVVRPDEER